jgi:hypothetical protein
MPSDDDDTVRALTICQPWAWAIMAGVVRFANRGEFDEHLGPLVIRSAKLAPLLEQGCRILRDRRVDLPRSFTFSAILGVVDVVDCIRPGQAMTDRKPDPFARGPWCLALERPRPLTAPIPYFGPRGLFRVPRELVAELLPAEAVVATPENESQAERIERAIAAAGGSLRPAAKR